MEIHDILSEKPEDIRETVQWAAELKARREKSELLTRELLKKFTPAVLKQQAAASALNRQHADI